MDKSRIWLTGTTGFIGRHLVKALKSPQVDVTCFTQKFEELQDLPDENLPVILDYLNPSDIEEKVKQFGLPDMLIHLGWGEMTSPESSFHLNNNVVIGKNLIEGLFKLGLKKVIFIGSMNQYGDRSGILSEDMAPQGRLTNYAKAKGEVEKLGFQAAKIYNKTFISVRTFYVFGSGQRQGSLINDLFQAHLKGTSVNLSPCEHYRDYIHVSDVVEGLKRISAINQSTIVNLGSGKVVKLKDFVIDFWMKMGGDIAKLKFGTKSLLPGEPEQPKSYADLTHLKKLTQWQPQLTLEEGILKTIENLYANVAQ